MFYILKKSIEKQIKQLLKNFEEFQITDLIGFGRILEVKEVDNFEEFCSNICIEFASKDFKRRRQLLKFSQDIVIANRNMQKKDSFKKS